LQPTVFYGWQKKLFEEGWLPRDHWLAEWEKAAIPDFERQYPLEGYRRLAFMMLDADVVAASPSRMYRVLKAGGRRKRGCGVSRLSAGLSTGRRLGRQLRCRRRIG